VRAETRAAWAIAPQLAVGPLSSFRCFESRASGLARRRASGLARRRAAGAVDGPGIVGGGGQARVIRELRSRIRRECRWLDLYPGGNISSVRAKDLPMTSTRATRTRGKIILPTSGERSARPADERSKTVRLLVGVVKRTGCTMSAPPLGTNRGYP
jgi:hypothetical protein